LVSKKNFFRANFLKNKLLVAFEVGMERFDVFIIFLEANFKKVLLFPPFFEAAKFFRYHIYMENILKTE
jgi:hypothetical protein